MVDTCSAVVPGDLNDATFDSATGEYSNPGTTLYTGKCRVSFRPWAEIPDAGGTAVVVARLMLSLPFSATALPVDCRVTITASRDAQMVGSVFRVRETMFQTDATARRYVVEGQQS